MYTKMGVNWGATSIVGPISPDFFKVCININGAIVLIEIFGHFWGKFRLEVPIGMPFCGLRIRSCCCFLLHGGNTILASLLFIRV